ncbi:MAG TPA: DUF2007 domain-containing protein [Chryseosolibacter sp.]|nr:DUF2007 domain-containing protein [Chryseosolibacter sp.]
MLNDRDDIIVFRTYDTVIDANIAKTKLDAYAIPCFLTEENMSSLYPGQSFVGFKVRLHLFAQDEERALQVLTEEVIENDPSCRCPKCNSGRLARDFPKQNADTLAFVFLGVLFPHKKINHCLDCDYEF